MGIKAIVYIVERGKANAIVKKAVEAGASGATIFFARGAGEDTFSFFHSLNIDSSKEVLLTLVPEEKKQAIMDAICEAAKKDEKSRGLLFSFSVDDIIGAGLQQQL